MSFGLYQASAPIFTHTLANMATWLDKALAEGKDEQALMEARLAEDMRPLPAQFQMASDSAKNCIARLAGMEPPAMPDTEASFAELKERCAKTIAYVDSIAPSVIDAAVEREVTLKFPSGMGYRFTGADYVTGFAVPNFFFHASMAYALFRKEGVTVGKPDFLRHLGMPIQIG